MDSEDSKQVLDSSRFQHYLLGTQKYLKVCDRFYDVLKLMEGEGTYGFKLINIRTELNAVFDCLNTKFSLSIAVVREVTQTLFRRLKARSG